MNIMLEEKLVELWPDYGCLFDVRSPDFKNRDKRQVAIEEIAIKLSLFRFVHRNSHKNYAAYKRKQLSKRPCQAFLLSHFFSCAAGFKVRQILKD